MFVLLVLEQSIHCQIKYLQSRGACVRVATLNCYSQLVLLSYYTEQ